MFEAVFYVLCAGLVGLSAWGLVKRWWKGSAVASYGPSVSVIVTGNVKNPGPHRIPWGSSLFDVYMAAGMVPTSDVGKEALDRPVKDGEKIHVGKLDARVDIEKSERSNACVLDFQRGPIEVTDKQGIRKNVAMGALLNEGDQIQCFAAGQAKLLWKDGSQIVLLENTRSRLDKILQPENGKKRNVFHVEIGKVYAKIQPLTGIEEFAFTTPHLRVTIRGTEFFFDVTPDETVFRLHDGFAFVQSNKGGDGVNLIAGQKIIAGGNETALRPEDFAGREDLDPVQILEEEKIMYDKTNRPFSMLLCGKPNTYIYFRMDAANQEMLSFHIPPNTWVGDMVVGFDEFEKAFLYGGGKFALSLAERLLHQKIEDYLVFGINDVQRSIDLVEGLQMDLDAKMAASLKLPAGPARLNGYQASRFMAPGPDFQSMAERQKQVLTSMYDALRKKSIMLSTSIVARAIGSSETSMSPGEAMQVYSTFNAVKGWNYRALTMPGTGFEREGKTLIRPLPNEIGALLVK